MSRDLVMTDYQTDFIRGGLGSAHDEGVERNNISRFKKYLKKGYRSLITTGAIDCGIIVTYDCQHRKALVKMRPPHVGIMGGRSV